MLAQIISKINPPRRHRECPRAVKRGRHNSYRIKTPDEPASFRHDRPPSINHRALTPSTAA